MKRRIYLLIALITAMWQCAIATDYFQDTVWTKKTDQLDGFYMVKFSNTDSLIVGHGYQMDLFFNAKTGEEIKRIPFNAEVHFIKNDSNFIRLAPSRNKLEIFDTKTFEVIDSLEHDTLAIGSIDISKDERYIIGVIQGGLRLWDLHTKQILKTKIFPSEPNLVYNEADVVLFTCEENKFIGHYIKTYQDPNHPDDQNYYKSYANYIEYNMNNLDSLNSYINARAFRLSHTCQYFAISTGDVYSSVEVYNFTTKQLLWKLQLNGPSLTGIEFSPDDKYVVTANGVGANCLKIWNMITGEMVYDYAHGTYSNFDISTDGNYIITSNGNYLFYLYAKYEPNSIYETIDLIQSTIYPNPSTGLTTINFTQPTSEITIINLTDLNGNQLNQVYNGFLEAGNQNIEVNTIALSSGTYFIQVHNTHISLTYKLIVN